mmetsp:Transcript_53962/g.108306  ORF Transcript_53962/g.108306 Transcript_53962/m.108306 type:complete len:187 (-) Transcript_53962:57-617(-)
MAIPHFGILLACFASAATAERTCEVGTVADLNRPLIPCCKVPKGFYHCQLLDCSGDDNDTSLRVGHVELRCEDGCHTFGGSTSDPAARAKALCTVLEGVPCTGNTTFVFDGFPCVRYNGHQFPTAVLLSLFLGWAGADRFYLGQVGWGVFKLFTVGGVGLWWFTDLMLLILGHLHPADGSSWEPQY